MPKVTGPLFSLEAAGTFDNTITYQRYKGGTRVITKPTSNAAPTDSQLYYRYVMQRLRADWSNQTQDTKSYWNQLADMRGIGSGYNLYIQSHFQFIRHYDCFTGLYYLNENDGGTLYDVSTYQNQGSTRNYASGDSISWTTGKNEMLGPALSFPGIGTVVELGENPQMAKQHFTIECWANPANIHPDYRVVYALDTFPYGLWLCVSGTDNFCALFSDSVDYSIMTGTTQPQAGQWYHIALTNENGLFRLYINGIQEKEEEATLNFSSSTPKTFLGAAKIYLNYGNHFNGKINFVATYSRALTVDEINYNFNRFNSV
jgi:hypothetical protein